MSELDLFDQLAGSDDAPMEGGGAFEDLPEGAWVLGRTATAANGGAAPAVRTFEKKEGGEFHRFKVGLIAKGGDKKITDQHQGRMAFFDAPLQPWEGDSGPVSGRLAGFLNSMFAQGIGADIKDPKERSKARWAATMSSLKEFAATSPQIDGKGVTLSAYGGDTGRYLTGLLISYLQETSGEILFKTRMSKNKKTGETFGIEAGGIEEATEANIEKRKVVRLDGGEDWT